MATATSDGALARAWAPVRRVLMAVGHVLGTINTAILLSAVYLVFMPFMRLGFALRRSDVLGRAAFSRGESTWRPVDSRAASPRLEDLEHPF